jgi:hypothetical protein
MAAWIDNLYGSLGSDPHACTTTISGCRYLGHEAEGNLPVFNEEGLVAWINLWFHDVEISRLSNSQQL